MITEKLTCDPIHKHQGKEHRYGGQRRCDHGGSDFGGAVTSRFRDRFPSRTMPGDVLQHHNRVIDEHPDAQGDTAQRHDVQRDIVPVHEIERRDDRHRNRHTDDDCRFQIPKKDEENHNGQQSTDNRGIGHIVDRLPDERRLIVDLFNLQPLGEHLVQLIQSECDRIRHTDRVRIALFIDCDFHRLAAVQSGNGFTLFVPLNHVCDIAQIQRFVVALGNHQIADLIHRGELIQRSHQILLGAFFQPAARQVDVLAA